MRKVSSMVMAVLGIGVAVNAATWTAGTGNWFAAGNWDTGVPVAGVDALIANAGTAQISSGAASAKTVYAGNTSGNGYLEMSGGSLTATNLYAGLRKTGAVTIGSSATATVSGTTGVGYYTGSAGTLNISGTMNAASVIIGNSTGSTGTVSLVGSLSASSVVLVNTNGAKGLFTLDGGSLTLTGDFDMDNQGASGSANASKLRIIGSDGTFSVGNKFLANGSDYSVIEFIADAGGVTTIKTVSNIGLNGTLNIDLSAYSGGFAAPLMLMNSSAGNLSGTFDAVNITGGTGSERLVYDVDNGDLMLVSEPANKKKIQLISIAGMHPLFSR